MSPDKPTKFENELANLPLRSVPPDLRNEILQHAEIVEPKRSWPSFLGLIWKVPLAIRVGVAAIWIVALCLNWATPGFEPYSYPGAAIAEESSDQASAELFAFHRTQVQRFLEINLNEIQ
ncbi:MAG: hypothetical protein ACI8UO_004984 [Verrucomicrobiales bacterium]|jgi:hypothetical protein